MEEMQKQSAALSSYHFKRAKTDGLIQVLNEGSYVMAEYSERTGVVRWQRVVLATQKEKIEKWLGEHYPVQAAPPPEKTAPAARNAASRARAVSSAR
jgi:hypothetical protein